MRDPGFSIEDYRDLYPFNSNYLDLDGHHYHFLDEGKGEPIVMLHGNPTWSFYFRKLVLALRDRYRVIVPDHMGCGLSDKPQDYPYRLAKHIDNVSALIRTLDLKRITFVLHDWGGMIGFGAAIRQVENIRRFVILNTGAFRLPAVNNFPASIAFCRLPGVGKLAVRVFNAFAKGASMTAATSDVMSKREKEALMAPYNSWKNRIATHKFVKDIPLNPKHPSYATLLDIENHLHLFQNHPKQIIWGQKDFCFDIHFLNEWKRFFPGVNILEIPQAGHYVLEDAPDQVIEITNGFLSST